MLEIMPESLSPREVEILRLISLEYTTPEIANKLYVSVETIRTHRKHLLEKFKARNMAGLVRRAYEYGIFSTTGFSMSYR
jgi:DNA-binding CsgD family transcriptional regulator